MKMYHPECLILSVVFRYARFMYPQLLQLKLGRGSRSLTYTDGIQINLRKNRRCSSTL